jgi:hypothetical protein
MIMSVNTGADTFTRVTQREWLTDKLHLAAAVAKKLQANLAGITNCTLKGPPTSIDPNRPPQEL